MRAHRHLVWFAVFAVSLALIAAVAMVSAQRTRAEIMDQGQRQLQLMAPELESALEKFETLPYVLSFQPDLSALLANPRDTELVARVNETLRTIAQRSKVSALYLMDREGDTLAASNYDQPVNFVGKNFRYRPYFRDARAGHSGRFYGIGSTTSEPGYFIAQPVMVGSFVAGVIAVKISLSEFEGVWRGSEAAVALTDRASVVFLSNRPQWKYRSLRPLSAQMQAELAATDQYAHQAIAPLDPASMGAYATQTIGRLGWQLMVFPATGRVLRSAAMGALGTALLLACAGVSGWALHQRRRRLEERHSAGLALQQAADELETQIAQRTGQLRSANAELEHKVAALKQTEHLLRSTQDELVQAGKLAMLGQMAAGMTHELNQPLAAIRAFADNARTFLARDQAAQASDNLAHIGDAAARMGAIIGQLKGFARKGETLALVDIAASIEASVFLLQSELRRLDVALQLELGPRPLHVRGDAVRIEQVFINLLRNALDAVETANDRRISVSLEPAGSNVRVTIRDSGPGIAADVAAQLFEPFFTTKPSGKGLGLGLAISAAILQAMNGSLAFHNDAGGGAQFEVLLPVEGA